MEKSWMPTTAGVLCIISGCMALVGFTVLAGLSFFFFNAPEAEFHEFPLAFVQFAFAVGAVCSLLLAWLAIQGGIACLRHRSWGWCLTGAIAALLIVPPLGVPAIVLVVIAEDYLRRAAAGA